MAAQALRICFFRVTLKVSKSVFLFIFSHRVLWAVQSVQYFLENVFIDVQNLIYRISIAFRRVHPYVFQVH